MPDLAWLGVRHLETAVLAFVRLGAMLAFAPVFGHRSVPVPHRAGLAALLAVLLAPLLGPGPLGGDADMIRLVLAMAGEAFVGLAIGFVAQLVIATVESAGELIGSQIGLGLTAVFDPSMAQQATAIARFEGFIALLLFLTLNGHHLLIQALAASFQRIPPGGFALEPGVAAGVVLLAGKLFRSSLDLAAPLLGLLVVLNAGMALLARIAPQTNVFLLTLPLSVGLGLIGLVQTFPAFSGAVAGLIDRMAGDLDALLRGATHGVR